VNVVIILSSTQITHLKSTSQVVHLTCTLQVSILLRIMLLHLTILRTLLCHHSVSTKTHFCLKFSHRSISPAAISSEDDINTQVLLE